MTGPENGVPAADSRLGQYFLTSPTKLALLIEAAGVRHDDRVLELGAGAGTVAAHVNKCASLTLVELDPKLARLLQERFPRARVHTGDALELVHELQFDVLLSNLPGDVTTRLLTQLTGLSFRVAVLAVDMSFRPEDLGASVAVEHIAVLDEDDFEPRQPEKSRLVRLKINSNTPPRAAPAGPSAPPLASRSYRC